MHSSQNNDILVTFLNNNNKVFYNNQTFFWQYNRFGKVIFDIFAFLSFTFGSSA